MLARIGRHRGTLGITLLNLTALGLIVAMLRDPRATAVKVLPVPTALPLPSATAPRLFVDVAGAVATADVVELPEGARVRDAVAAAGGFSEAADRAMVNLAAPLVDGQQLYVPAKGEVGGSGVTGGGVGVTGGVGATNGLEAVAGNRAGTGARPAGGPGGSRGIGAGGGAGSAAGNGEGGGAINVNTATAAELEALPGVGPALAGRIVAYRAANGPFASPQDLLAVSGIGEKTLARFVEMVRVR